MEEVWERAVESALDGQTDSSSTRSLNLDGAIKYLHGRLLPPALLGKFGSLEQLSLANNGISSLENFPRLKNLQKLVLSDNRITNALEFLVGLDSLRDLDLSNNRIQFVEDLAPLEKLKLVSLDLYECPVTKVDNYRARVFAMINTLRYLDKMDAQNNERPESDEEDENEDDEEEEDADFEEDNDVLGSGEVDSDNLNDEALDVEDGKNDNGNTATDGKMCSVGKEKKPPSASSNGDWKEDDAHGSDEEEEDVEDEEVDGDEEAPSTGDVLEEDEDEDDGDTLSVDHLTSTEGELDQQGQSEEQDDDNEEVEDVDREDEDQDEEDDDVGDYLVQPVVQPKKDQETGVDDLDDDGVDEDHVEEGCVQPSLHSKRRRSESDFNGAVKDRMWAKRR